MNVVTGEKKSNFQITEQDILKSLEDAVSSYTKKDFEILKPKTRKTSKKTKIESNENNLLSLEIDIKPETEVKTKRKSVTRETPLFSTVSEMSDIEESQVLNDVNDKVNEEVVSDTETLIKKNSKKTKKTPKETKKSLRKKKNKKVSRKSFFSYKKSKTVILPERKNGLYYKYKKQIATATLTFVMLSFVAMSSYIAYAYVANANGDLVEKVSNHVVLPLSETPKVYIIQSEKSEIFKNPLFSGIEIGDNVLSYTSAGKVIIYRGSEDKIVNIVNTSQFSAQ